MKDNFSRKSINCIITAPPEILMNKLKEAKASQKKNFIGFGICLCMMFINIFITAYLTGTKAFSEFSDADRYIITVMGIIEIATVALCFYFANKSGKSKFTIEKLIFETQKTVIETAPLLPGNTLKVFADENYSGRLTVFGYPNENSVYYTVEGFDPDYAFLKIYESEIFETIDQISNGFENFIDLTEKFELHKSTAE